MSSAPHPTWFWGSWQQQRGHVSRPACMSPFSTFFFSWLFTFSRRTRPRCSRCFAWYCILRKLNCMCVKWCAQPSGEHHFLLSVHASSKVRMHTLVLTASLTLRLRRTADVPTKPNADCHVCMFFMHISTFTNRYTHIHAWIHAYSYRRMAFMHTSTRICVCVCTSSYMFTCIHVCVCVCVYIYIYIYTHTLHTLFPTH